MKDTYNHRDLGNVTASRIDETPGLSTSLKQYLGRKGFAWLAVIEGVTIPVTQNDFASEFAGQSETV